MMGLMILGALAVYLLVSIWVTKTAVSWAKANNKKLWLVGWVSGFYDVQLGVLGFDSHINYA